MTSLEQFLKEFVGDNMTTGLMSNHDFQRIIERGSEIKSDGTWRYQFFREVLLEPLPIIDFLYGQGYLGKHINIKEINVEVVLDNEEDQGSILSNITINRYELEEDDGD